MKRLLSLPLILFVLAGAVWARAAQLWPVREPVLAGSWYPATGQTLRQMTSGFLAEAKPPPVPGRLIALISPHAGYVYSGQTAAYAYKLLEAKKFDTVVLVGPSHRESFEGVAAFDQGDFKTPLGTVPLDLDLLAKLLAEAPFIRSLPGPHAKEHSLEIQLPLLQTAMPGFKLVPLLMGRQDEKTSRRLGEVLAKACRGRSVLLVASTDLSHFHDDATARRIDAVFTADVAAFDADTLLSDLAAGRCEACGGGPAAAVMLAAGALGADTATLLKYATSAESSGEKSQVVGYLAAALSASGEKKKAGAAPDKAPDKGKPAPPYSGSEQKILKAIALDAIKASFDNRSQASPADLPDKLKEKRGAFVTLKIHGQLRGCIGHIAADMPLNAVVASMARAAAFQDPRFPSLRKEELASLEIEISVLTLPKRISDVSEVTVGRDGIIMQKGFRSGLLLPQVATEWGWDRTTFLSETCRKSGLPPQCFKDPDTEISIFSADVF